jgi:hypothetical protein
MFKGHMSLLYMGCKKFLTNWFTENLCLQFFEKYKEKQYTKFMANSFTLRQ